MKVLKNLRNRNESYEKGICEESRNDRLGKRKMTNESSEEFEK